MAPSTYSRTSPFFVTLDRFHSYPERPAAGEPDGEAKFRRHVGEEILLPNIEAALARATELRRAIV
jgi:hypothetical protein